MNIKRIELKKKQSKPYNWKLKESDSMKNWYEEILQKKGQIKNWSESPPAPNNGIGSTVLWKNMGLP